MIYFRLKKHLVLMMFLISILISPINSQILDRMTNPRFCWSFSTEKIGNVQPITINNRIILPLSDQISAISFKGELIWTTDLNGEIINIDASDNELVVITKSKGFNKLTKSILQTDNGLIKYRFEDVESTTISKINEEQKTDTARIIIENQTIRSLSNSKSTKEKIWEFKAGGRISSLITTNENLLVSSWDNFLYLLNAKTGKTIWKKRFNQRIETRPLIYGKLVIIVTKYEEVAYILSLRDGHITVKINFPFESKPILPAIYTNGFILFPTTTGLLVYSDTCLK